ncbi:MAG: two-component system response regulator [Bacteroidetes bacterium GWF2_49_14]|nr:MAG: two-component system response regulator [Bacteroidetes bacterium GWF2_49_14]HBB93421.1 DNA-binding response regulator [Bacteroidales bacterium]
MKIKVFYIEDEQFLGKIVSESLESEGFDVLWEMDGAAVLNQFSRFSPDICVVDIMLPNIDGYTLCRQIRSLYPALPIIFLTAKTETADLVKGFDAGGTDYIRKPFSMEELVVRIHNQLQLRTGMGQRPAENREEILIGKYRFYPRRYELHAPSGIIRLSQRDMQVLSILASAPNRVTDRRELLLSVWGDDSFFNSRNLDVYIRKLREYLKEDPGIQIQTLKGKGYLFMTDD